MEWGNTWEIKGKKNHLYLRQGLEKETRIAAYSLDTAHIDFCYKVIQTSTALEHIKSFILTEAYSIQCTKSLNRHSHIKDK